MSGDPADLFHARPSWVGDDEDAIGEHMDRLIVAQRLCESRRQAHLERQLRGRTGRPLRHRVGLAIAGLGTRIAGSEPAARRRPT